MAFRLISSAFQMGEPIPVQYTCDGANVSPPLNWADVPKNAQSLALIFDDPDAPKGLWTHWVVYNIDPSMGGMPENFANSNQNAKLALNTYQNAGYDGPCPPANSRHTYHFRLYALDEPLDLPDDVTRVELLARMQGHVLGSAELTGTYSRQEARAAR